MISTIPGHSDINYSYEGDGGQYRFEFGAGLRNSRYVS